MKPLNEKEAKPHQARYFAVNGMDKTEIVADSIIIATQDGQEIEIHFRKSDGEISLSARSRLVIYPMAGNVVRVADEK